MGSTPITKDITSQKYHFIGIGGIGMSALARLLLARNVDVSGSDVAENYVTEMLSNEGATVYIGHAHQNVVPKSTVVYTTGIDENNPEYVAAKQLDCDLLHRSDLLQALSEGYKMLAVAGTHGKTTTSALLTHVLLSAGCDPAFAIGGVMPQYKSNGAHGSGPYFVVEACESDGTFLKYTPFGSIVTNIDIDHLDYFGSEETLKAAFYHFIATNASEEHLFWCGDDLHLQRLSPNGFSYGFSKDCHWKISNFSQNGWHITFDVESEGKLYSSISLPLVGKHNAYNATAVFGLCLSLGLPEGEIRKAFLTFGGVKRRCDCKGISREVLVIDDYAHHPVEIETTLKGIREAIGSRRLIAVYQPHRYTRTRDCMGGYANVFDAADEVILTDLYEAGEKLIEGVSDAKILEDIAGSNRTPVRFISKKESLEKIASLARPHDVIVTLGAGDITHLGTKLLERFAAVPPDSLRLGVIFGGASSEHEISLLSARNIVSAFDRNLYNMEFFAITKEGHWLHGEAAENYLQGGQAPRGIKESISSEVLSKLQQCDVLFPILHGPYGEDGTIQGFFEMLRKPYVGCCHRSAAIAMDKVATKELAAANKVPIVDYIQVSRYEWKEGPGKVLEAILDKLFLPLFVKPTHLGSSIGVSRVVKEEDLREAVEKAFNYDDKILIETEIIGREIEFAVLGNAGKEKVFSPGEVIAKGQVYTYEAKYGPQGISVNPVADLPSEKIEEGIALAKKAYQAIGCRGMSRVDFFLDKKGKFWLNEINPIPGFTVNSLYPLMCQKNGLEYAKLLDALIILGLEAHRQSSRRVRGI